jgi:hypothetical protein
VFGRVSGSINSEEINQDKQVTLSKLSLLLDLFSFRLQGIEGLNDAVD